jgi:hypothetical protein
MKLSEKEILALTEKLGILLKKSRNPQPRGEVDAIIQNERDLAKRIQLIEEVDDKYVSKLAEEDIKNSDQRKTRKSINFTNDERFNPTGFLKYFFGTRKKMAEFAEKTGVIKATNFGTQYTLSGNAIAVFKKLKLKDTGQLHKKMKSEILSLWQKVNPLDYNLFIIFFQSVEGFFHISTAIQEGKRDPKELLQIGQPFFNAYLTLDQDENYIERLAKVIDFEFANPENKPNLESIRSIYEYFFQHSTKLKPFSFKEILLGLFNLRYRRLFTIEEVDLAFGIQQINKTDYNVPGDLKFKINLYFNELEKNLQQIDEELFRIQLIKKELLSQNKEGKYVFPLFGQILTKVFQASGVFDEKLKGEMKIIISNPLRLVRELCSYIINHISLIFKSKIFITTASGQAAVTIFDYKLFQDEIQSIGNILTETDKISIKHPNFQFSFARYYDGKKNPFANDSPEKIASDICDQTTQIFYAMAEKLLQIILNHNHAEKLEAKDRANLKKKSNDALEETKPKIRFIPFYKEIIISKGLLSQRTPFMVILELTQILYQISLIFRKEELLKILRSEPELNREKEKIKKYLVPLKK